MIIKILDCINHNNSYSCHFCLASCAKACWQEPKNNRLYFRSPKIDGEPLALLFVLYAVLATELFSYKAINVFL